nr:ester cyclase [uncultured Dethiosulfovibrio sp.]
MPDKVKESQKVITGENTEESNMKDGKKGNVVFTGDSKQVVSVGHHDYNEFSKLERKPQGMKGFDPEYRDFVEYIMKITHTIWEEKSIGLIYDTYSNNVVMHLGSTNASGIQGVISGTMQTLFAFPDRRLIGQNVIWSPHGEKGYLSSHRILSTATNLNPSSFGPATGKRINFRTTVDCAAEDNRIYEEWLVRDNLWIVRQLGFDVFDVARRMAKAAQNDGGLHVAVNGMGENKMGQYSPKLHAPKDDSAGEFILEMLSRVYNYRLFNEVDRFYHDNAVVHFVCDQDMTGKEQIKGMLISLFSSFPNGALVVERVTCNEKSDGKGHDVAVRWRINGVNEGFGYFGAPTGKHATILGISHFSVKDGKIDEEWITFDGMDVLKQLISVEE